MTAAGELIPVSFSSSLPKVATFPWKEDGKGWGERERMHEKGE
jgi:hypothetical protein